MQLLIGTPKDLRARLAHIYGTDQKPRPLAVLVGSGVTSSVIPGPSETIERIRKLLTEEDRTDLDDILQNPSDDGAMYQRAFSFLALRRSPEFRDHVIRLCTLRAYRGTFESADDFLPERLDYYETQVDQWKLPKGIAALGRIWAGTGPGLRGPILTSNFDPLCEVAIRKAGGVAVTNVIDADGSFLRDVRISSEPHVVHFHGFWRKSATLSMWEQLEQERPALAASLRGVLGRNTLLVLGYGGWDDALTREIARTIRGQEAGNLDVLWCYHRGRAELEAEMASEGVLARISEAAGNVRFYCDIDANDFLPDLERHLADRLTYSGGDRLASARGTLIGWAPVPSIRRPRDGAEERAAALSFFDGRLPNWDDAASALIPVRDAASSVANQVKAAIANHQSSLSLMIGPSGEGKTTALMQAASVIAHDRADVAVLFHPEGDLPPISEVMALPQSQPYVLMFDEGFRSIDRLRTLVCEINKSGRLNLHLVVASRRSDWQSGGGAAYAWKSQLRTFEHQVGGMTRLDAVAVIDAWQAIGREALGSLAGVDGREARIQTLLAAAQEAGVDGEGAFLGALLATRYGPDLRTHVQDLMERLALWSIDGGDWSATLLDAFLATAFPQALGVRSLSPEVLARAVGISVDDLHYSVLLPLGQEAALGFSRRVVLVRHQLIAEAAVDLSGKMGVDLGNIVHRLITAAVEQIEQDGYSPELHDLAYLSRRIPSPELSVLAARAAADAAPRRLSYVISLSRALRKANRAAEAAALLRAGAPWMLDAQDTSGGIRAYLTEWGVVEGNRGNWKLNVALAAGALADQPRFGDLRREEVETLLNCLGVAFGRLAEGGSPTGVWEALAGLGEVAYAIGLRASVYEWLEDLEAKLERRHVARPTSVEQGIKALGSAVRDVLEDVASQLPQGMPRIDGDLSALARICA